MVAAIALLACLPMLILSVMAIDLNIRKDSRFKSWRLISICESGSAWFLGLIFLSGGLSKLMPFPGFIGPVWLEDALGAHGLGLFARFIAWSEALIGLLLLSKITRVAGAIMLVPLVANILMVTISLNWRGTPWVIMFFIANNLFLLAFHFNRWRPIVDAQLDWLSRRKNGTRLSQTRAVSAACMLAIGVAPVLNNLNWIFSVSVVACGFAGLVWAEYSTRFQDRFLNP